MHIFITIILFLIGIILIVKGGDFFVDAASWIAEASGIPKLIIGATIVSLATTLPELIVSLIAATNGNASMAIGNAVGSVTANTGLIMGISVVCIPSVVKKTEFSLKAILLIFSSALLWVFIWNMNLSKIESIAMLAVLVFFIWENLKTARGAMLENKDEDNEKTERKTITKNIFKMIVGAVAIVIGAQFLVNYGSEIARLLGVSDRIIGFTMVAIGTSLPELVTTITAITKKQASLSIGNIIGANIIDLTLILPVCALVSMGGVDVPATELAIKYMDLPVCLFIISIAIIPTLITKKFKRIQGIFMLLAYIAYLITMCGGFIKF